MSAQTATILVTDLVGSTELRVRLGEEQADALRHVHDELITSAIAAHEGTVVKGLGDGFLAMFPSSADAVAAAVLALQEAHLHSRREPDLALAIRVGISVGDVTVEDGDCFGTPVIEASRLCAAAEGNQVLAADLVEALARGRGGHEYVPAGELSLKGLPEPVKTVEVRWTPPSTGRGAQPAFPPLLQDERSVPFVGREDERDVLATLWKQAATGQRRCALLAGEPGVGKTRLAGEIAQRAHDDGAVVLLGRCDEELGLPFQPFVEALAYFVAHGGPSAADLGRHPGDLVRLYPELVDLVPDLGEPVRGDADVERHRLFEATTSWLAAAAAPAGLVIVLDDLHWAGKPTLLLLRHLLRAAPDARILVVGTYRDTDLDRTHPLSELLADLRREPGVERLALSGFTSEEVEAFVAAAAGEELDDPKRALAAAVHAETEGNAFFVGEVLRHLAETGALVQRDGVWQATIDLEDMAIPEGVREVIGRRVSRMSDVVNESLRWASVIGRDIDFAVLADVVDGTDDDLLAALDEATDARLVEETGPGRYRFVHALVRSTLLEEVRTTRRVRMHLRIAESLERRRPDDLTALAYHFQEAASASEGAWRSAIAYTEQAAQRAADRAAFDEAVALYHQGLDLLDDGPEPDESRRLDLLLGLGTAAFALGGGEHESVLADTVALARSLSDGERMGAALLAGHRGWSSTAFALNAPLVDDLETALDLLPDQDSATRVRILAALALELVFDRTEQERSSELMAAAVDVARRLGDDRLTAEVISSYWMLGLANPSPEEEAALAGEVGTAADRVGDLTVQANAVGMGYQVALRRAHLAEGEVQLRRFSELAEMAGTAVMQWTMTFTTAGFHLYRGDHDEAEPLVEAALRLGVEAGQPDAYQYYGNQLAFLRRQQGRPAEVVDLITDWIAPNPPGHEYWRGCFSLLLTEAGRPDEARPQFEQGFSIFVDHAVTAVFLPHAATLAHAAVDLGDRTAAAGLLERLTPFRGELAQWRPLSTLGPVDLATARLLLLLDRPDEAAPDLVASAAMCERGGLRPFLAQTRLAQGEVARAQGDDATARACFEDARAQATDGGFGTTERRARAALASAI
jgi:class 3 adenylate cyclase/tetratricopeptide (TPR) repeat protein